MLGVACTVDLKNTAPGLKPFTTIILPVSFPVVWSAIRHQAPITLLIAFVIIFCTVYSPSKGVNLVGSGTTYVKSGVTFG